MGFILHQFPESIGKLNYTCFVCVFHQAQELMLSVEMKGKEKESIVGRISEQRRALIARTGVDVNKKLRVCDVCGSFLSILDSDKRLADHFMGKQHIGYQLMRDTIEAIKTRRDERR